MKPFAVIISGRSVICLNKDKVKVSRSASEPDFIFIETTVGQISFCLVAIYIDAKQSTKNLKRLGNFIEENYTGNSPTRLLKF